MINLYPYDRLGQADYGWLKPHYHFSFSDYQNPDRMGFGTLRVINDDIIAPGAGFDPHSHENMEIITYVRQGAITHKDSMGNEGRTEAGDVQVMSAGSGIRHSEFNLEDEETRLYQIWIEPNETGVTPRWEAKAFPKDPVGDALPLLVAGDATAPLFIHADARIYGGRLLKGKIISHPIRHQAYVLASEGELEIDGQRLQKGDGAEVTATDAVSIHALTDSEILILDVPETA